MKNCMRIGFRKAGGLSAIDIKSKLSMKKSCFDIKTHEFLVTMVGVGKNVSNASHFCNWSIS